MADTTSPVCKRRRSRSASVFRMIWGVFNNVDARERQLYRFVCVEVLRSSQSNGVMSSAVSLPVLLESAEGREWPQKIFHHQSPGKNAADLGGGRTRDLFGSPVGRASNWATEAQLYMYQFMYKMSSKLGTNRAIERQRALALLNLPLIKAFSVRKYWIQYT